MNTRAPLSTSMVLLSRSSHVLKETAGVRVLFSSWLQQSAKAAPPCDIIRSRLLLAGISACRDLGQILLEVDVTAMKAAPGCSRSMDKRDWSFEGRAGYMLAVLDRQITSKATFHGHVLALLRCDVALRRQLNPHHLSGGAGSSVSKPKILTLNRSQMAK